MCVQDGYCHGLVEWFIVLQPACLFQRDGKTGQLSIVYQLVAYWICAFIPLMSLVWEANYSRSLHHNVCHDFCDRCGFFTLCRRACMN